ncbi:MAG: histidine kinase N-terminal 7TM domain-containing protein [Patescibacteria group bacterium]|nr:histidine kinase N-terminal 7TM domain-containing protein [bacterium]MDZ4240925.1 histidine kinase N-terminal 7TM domain-containing protein [Patescibacteria group bacterium]
MDFSHINFYSLSALINFFSSFMFGTFIYVQNRKDPISVGYARFAWVIAAWSITYAFLLQSNTPEGALLGSRITLAPVCFIAITFFHFIVVLLGETKKYRKMLWFGYIVFTLFALLDVFYPTPLFITNPQPTVFIPYWPLGGILFHPFLFLWVAYFVAAYTLPIIYFKQFGPVKKSQIIYVLIGTTFGNIGGSTAFLVFYGVPVIPPIIVLSFMIVMMGYAMFKHGLFNIRVIAVEVLTLILWIFLLGKIALNTQTGQLDISDAILFLSFVVIGILIIRSGIREEKQKEKLAELNAELDYLNKNLKEKVDEQTKEIRTAYEVEKEARLQLEKLNEAKNEFILASQHNLRTPITIAKGYVEETESHLQDGKTVDLKEYLDKTKGVLETLSNLVNGLIDVTDLKVGREGFSKKE